MITGNESKGFFAAHWDWLVAGLGLLALGGAAAFLLSAYGVDPDSAAADEVASLGRGVARDKIEEVNMLGYGLARKGLESPVQVAEPAEEQASFLASGARIFCEQGDPSSAEKACGLPIPLGAKTCPFCGAKQPEEAKVSLDSDGDGIPDEVEKKWGLNPNDPADADGDLDGDGFTNLEEYEAGTDPTDKASHPDYLDSLKLVPPLRETPLPFLFDRAMHTPSGTKFYFKDPKRKNAFGGVLTYEVFADQPIGKTGFVAKKYERKSRKVKIDGANVPREQDVSTATIVRPSDGKTLTLTVQDKRHVAVDIQAKLVYERGGTKEFSVVPGDSIELSGSKYKVVDIRREGKTAKVVLEGANSAKKTLEALEQ